MKQIIIIITFAIAVPLTTFAQTSLPSAGITPESNLYFLDKLGEALKEFFTFDAEAKIRLQVTFAEERIAEIKTILENNGVDAPGLAVAQARLKSHLAKAGDIFVRGKVNDNEEELASEISDELDENMEALEEIYTSHKEELKSKIEEFKNQIRQARLAGDDAQVETLTTELNKAKVEKELLESETKKQEEALEVEQDKIEDELEDKLEAEKAIQEAEEKKQEILDEAKKEGVTLPANSIKQYEQLLAQAKELLGRGNYQGAESLAKQAKRHIDKSAESLEDVRESSDETEELKQTEKELEEEAKKGNEKAREEEKKIEEEREEAEKKLLEEQKELREDN